MDGEVRIGNYLKTGGIACLQRLVVTENQKCGVVFTRMDVQRLSSQVQVDMILGLLPGSNYVDFR